MYKLSLEGKARNRNVRYLWRGDPWDWQARLGKEGGGRIEELLQGLFFAPYEYGIMWMEDPLKTNQVKSEGVGQLEEEEKGEE